MLVVTGRVSSVPHSCWRGLWECQGNQARQMLAEELQEVQDEPSGRHGNHFYKSSITAPSAFSPYKTMKGKRVESSRAGGYRVARPSFAVAVPPAAPAGTCKGVVRWEGLTGAGGPAAGHLHAVRAAGRPGGASGLPAGLSPTSGACPEPLSPSHPACLRLGSCGPTPPRAVPMNHLH